MRGVPRARRAISAAAVRLDRHVEDPRRPAHDLLEVGRRVELQPVRDAEPRAQRRGEQPGARRRADQREGLEPHLHRARARPLADDDVDLVVFERGIEDLLDRRRHPVDLVDEEHFAGAEVGDDADEIARLLDRRSGRRAHRARPSRWRSRRPASSCRGRAVRAAARDRAARRAACAAAIATCRFSRIAILADVLVEEARTQPGFVLRVLVDARRGDETVVRYFASSRNACLQRALEARVGGRAERFHGGVRRFFGERPMITQVHERREHIVAQHGRGGAARRRGRGGRPRAAADPSARARCAPRFSCRRRESP